MSYFCGILQGEFLKTKKSAVRRGAIAAPLSLSLLAVIQQGYFSQNVFNWYYVFFLPITFSLISAATVSSDYRRHRLRALRSFPAPQKVFWIAKLIVAAVYACVSCLLLSVAVMIVPKIFAAFGVEQVRHFRLSIVMVGIAVMFVTCAWQIPFCFLLTKKLGVIFTVAVNWLLSVAGVLAALKPYWVAYPWAWVNRCMIVVIDVLPNGLSAEHDQYAGVPDVIWSMALSAALTGLLAAAAIKLYAGSEAR